MTPWFITLSSRTDSRGQGARVRGPLAARTNGSTARSESACICGGALRQYNLAQELGEDFNGLKELQGLAKFLETKKPFIGFGESAPVDGSYDDDTESQEDRRVEVLFFEEGQEPNVALLDEDPKVSELYQGDAFRRVEIDAYATGTKRAPLVIDIATPNGQPLSSLNVQVFQFGRLIADLTSSSEGKVFVRGHDPEQTVEVRTPGHAPLVVTGGPRSESLQRQDQSEDAKFEVQNGCCVELAEMLVAIPGVSELVV